MKILVVDDEISVRKTVCNIILQKLGDKADVIQCSNGEEAWSVLETVDIDLLMSDIRMPGMDGISLAKKARESGKNCGIIFLSAYDHKEYLKAAIELKSIAYIDKPIDKETLFGVLDDVMETHGIHHSRNADQNNSNLVEYLISSEIDEKKAKQMLEEVCCFKSTRPVFAVCVLKFRGLKDLCLSRQTLENELKELSSDVMCCLFKQKDNHTYVLIFVTDEKNDIRELVRQKLLDIQSKLSDRIKMLISIGKESRGYKGIYESYKNSACLIEYGFYSDYGLIENGIEDTSSAIDITKKIDEFNKILEDSGKGRIFEYLENLYNDMKNKKCLPVMVTIFFFKQIIYQIYLNLYSKKNGDDYDSVLKYMNANDTDFLIFDELYEFVIAEAERMIEESKTDNIVYEIKRYIEQEYQSPDISLEEISEKFHLSIGYMCSKFRNVAGISINNYLTTVRMNRAKDLIKSGKLSAEEITYVVGYNDPNYFSRNFKKHTGMTVSEYRKKVNE